MKRIYISAWGLFSILFAASVLTGSLNDTILTIFRVAALTMIYAFAIWAVFANPGNTEPDDLRN